MNEKEDLTALSLLKKSSVKNTTETAVSYQGPHTNPKMTQLKHSQVLQMKYQPLLSASSANSNNSTSFNISSLPNSFLAQLPANFSTYPLPHQQQIIQQLISRNSSSQHYRARIAAAAARNTTATNPTPSVKLASSIGDLSQPQNTILENSNSSWSTLDIGGMASRVISKELFKFSFLTALYLNHNHLKTIPSQICKLKLLVTLDISCNQIKVVPPEIGQLTNLKELFLFDNQITNLPFEFGSLYQLEFLGLEGNHIAEPIFSFYQKHGTSSVISFLRDNAPVIQPPNDREWHVIENVVNSSESFTVCTYNVLCDKYATQQAYGYAPAWALNWDYRKDIIINEILAYNADLICLQEVETSQFSEFFKEHLMRNGYNEGLFYPKSRSKTMNDREKKFVDGCAIFFKEGKFVLKESLNLEYNQLCISKPEIKRTDDMCNRVMTKDNIGVLMHLEFGDSKHPIIVGNTHIHWDPLQRDVKLVQTALFMEQVEVFLKRTNPKSSVILCGDFNSLPGSGVFDLISTGVAEKTHEDFGNYEYQPYSTHGCSHQLQLKSAYGSSIGELEFTNYTPSFSGVIDYIFYSYGSLSVTGVLGGIPEDYVQRVVGFPNPHFPSDHISLLVELKLKKNEKEYGKTTNAFHKKPIKK